MVGMRFSNEKARSLDKISKMEYLSKYHRWLKEQRERDKGKIDYRHISTGQHYLKQDLCPYCKNKLETTTEENLIFKKCEKHGLVQIRRWDGKK